MTLSTSRNGECSSKSTRNGRRTRSATKAPTPCRVITSPSARSAATASRITVRLTPVAAIIACSVGSRDPGGNLPLVMSAVEPRHQLGRQPARGIERLQQLEIFRRSLGQRLDTGLGGQVII